VPALLVVSASWLLAATATFQAGAASSLSATPEAATLRLVPDDVALLSDEYAGPDGKRHRDELQTTFDEDVARVAIVGWRKGHVFGLADEVEVAGFDFLTSALVPRSGQPVRFRAGSRVGKHSEKWWLVADGKKVASEDWIGTVAVSRDGSSCAYWTEPGAKLDESGATARGSMQFVLDGRRGLKWDDADALGEPQFSRDGDKVATAAMKSGKWRVLVVSRRGEVALDTPFAAIGDLAWRPDGAELAYAADEFELDFRNPRTARGNAPHTSDSQAKFRICFGLGKDVGTWGTAFDDCGDPVWTPNGQSVAYRMRKEKKLGVGVDGLAWIEPFASALGSPAVSPDGKHVAVAARVTAEDPRPLALRRHSELAAPDDHWVLARDGEKDAKRTEWQRVADPVFSPDSASVAFAAQRGGRWFVVVGDTTSGDFDAVGPPHFTADGRHVFFGARRGREVRRELLAVASPAETKPDAGTSKRP
jgi:Tol biopolymer transport system component